MDFQKPYMRTILGFIGITDVKEIAVEPTMMGGPEGLEEAKKNAAAQAKEIAAKF